MIFGKKVAFMGALLVVVCWPFASGQMAQKLLEARLENTQFEHVDIKIERYERGYLYSDIEIKLTATNAFKTLINTYDIPDDIIIDASLTHGFFNVLGKAKMLITPAWQKALASFGLLEESPFHANFDISFLGNIDIEGFSKKIQANYKALQVQASPMYVSALIDRDNHLFFTSHLPKLTLQEEAGKMILTELGFKFDGYYLEDSVWIGQQEMNFASVEFIDETKRIAKLDQFSAQSENKLQSVLLTDVALIGKVDETPKKLEQEIEKQTDRHIESINRLKIANVFVEHLGDYQAIELGVLVKDVNFDLIKKMAKEYEQSASVQKTQSLMSTFIALLAKGIELEVSPIQMKLPQGKIAGKVHLSIDKGQDLNPANLLALTNKIKGELRFNLPTKVVQTIPSLSHTVKKLAEKGFSQEDKGTTDIDIFIDMGKIRGIDGQSLPLSTLPFLLM
jgi:uncharacterized protein YdgA (DUF945 family)